MEDKIFDLLAKLHSDMTEQFKSVKEDIKGLKNDIIRMENNHGKKLDALFDGYKQLSEGQEEVKSQVSALTEKVDSQDVQITVLKGGKSKQNRA